VQKQDINAKLIITQTLLKMMTLKGAITVLENYNKWRRGDETIEMPNPTVLGMAIDIILNKVKK
jgi:hypothetical protein